MPDAATERIAAGAAEPPRAGASLPDWPVGTFLALLRIARGWRRIDLAQASGLPMGYLSEYENGKKTPEFKTLRRMLEAMGYSQSALDRTRRFLDDLRADAFSADFAAQARTRTGWAAALADDGRNLGADLAWELDRVTEEAGHVLTRLLRATILLSRGTTGAAEPAGPENPR